MIPEPDPHLPTEEEFFAQIRKTQAELLVQRFKAWEKVLVDVDKILEDASYLKDSDARTAMFTVMQTFWTKGYNDGIKSMSKYMARQLGAGKMVDLHELTEQQLKQKPENN